MTSASRPDSSSLDADLASASGRGEPLVGVLGGMGPAATADFYAKLIRHTPARCDQEHLRVAIWADPTVPDRVSAVLDGGTDPYPLMLAGAQRLRGLGATVVAMPCNSAHFFLDRLEQDTALPFVDMVRGTVTALADDAEPVGQVGLLGTRATLRSGLYQLPLSRAGIAAITPDESDQALVDTAIRHVKAGRIEPARQLIRKVAHSLTRSGVQAIVLACTELPLAIPAAPTDSRCLFIDPTDLLARAVVRQCSVSA